MNEIKRPWTPMPPRDAARLLRTYPGRWWIAGGWSLDLFLGHPTRLHEDTDVLILHRDLRHIHATLRGWTIHAANPPGTLTPWTVGEVLPDDIRPGYLVSPTRFGNVAVSVHGHADGRRSVDIPT
jgi:hypothetical protein